MPKLSVVILNYNTRDYIVRCLGSIEEQNLDISSGSLEVIVADNGSTDGSSEKIRKGFPWVKLIENKRNIGFAAGNNRAIRKAKGELLLLLNSDTVVLPDAFEKLVKFMDERTDAGAVTGKLVLPDGAIDLSCHRGSPTPWNAFTYFVKLEQLFPNSPFFSGYHQTWKDFDAIHEVDAISGACFMVRTKVVEQVGLLDERYFMYAEDLDWCMRIRDKGWKIYYDPEATVIHFKKRSGRKKDEGKQLTDKTKKIRSVTTTYFNDTMQLFYDKHYKDKYPLFLRKLVFTGIWLFGKIRTLRSRWH